MTISVLPAMPDDLFSRAQALDSGLTDREIAGLLRDRIIIRLRHGWYCLRSLWDELDDIGQHVLLARSVVASQRGRVALFGVSAAAVHGLRIWGHDLGNVHLIRLDDGPSRRLTNVVHHVTRAEPGLCEVDGLLTTDLTRTVWDVARTSTLESGVVTVDSALARDPGLRHELLAIADRFTDFPRARQGKIAIRLADGRAENGGESICRVGFYRHGIEKPDLQVVIRSADGRFIARVDFYWERYRHVGEFDGMIKYTKLLTPGRDASKVVIDEKLREDEVRGTHRGMTRFVWAGVDPRHPLVVRATMRDFRRRLHDSHRLFVAARG